MTPPKRRKPARQPVVWVVEMWDGEHCCWRPVPGGAVLLKNSAQVQMAELRETYSDRFRVAKYRREK